MALVSSGVLSHSCALRGRATPNVPSVPVPTACSSENRALSPPAQHVNSWPGASVTTSARGQARARPGPQQGPPQRPERGTVTGSPAEQPEGLRPVGAMPGPLSRVARAQRGRAESTRGCFPEPGRREAGLLPSTRHWISCCPGYTASTPGRAGRERGALRSMSGAQ